MPIITVAREAASFGDELAERLARKTGYPLINFDRMIDLFLKPIASDHERQMLETSTKFFFEPISQGEQTNFKSYLEGAIKEWAKTNDAIMLGCAGERFLTGNPRAIHLKIIADNKIKEQRMIQAQSQYRIYRNYLAQNKEFHTSINSIRELIFLERFISPQQIVSLKANDLQSRIDRQYRKLSSTLFHGKQAKDDDFHLILNTGLLSLENCLSLTACLIEEYRIRRRLEKQTDSSILQTRNSDLPNFKNESESEFARLLNLYHIDWRYEPKFFPVEWDKDKNVTMAFSPDFYLPKFDVYLELTTMNQKYVTAKKRKLEKLRELYPGVNVKIIYKRDFMSLLERFNG